MNSIKSQQYSLLVALVVVAGLVAGLALVRSLLAWPLFAEQTASGSSVSTANFIPPPKRVAELAGKADVIVIGTVGVVINQGAFQGYDAAGNAIPGKATGHPDLPITDFRIIVEKVLKDEAPEAVVRAIRTVLNGDTWYSQPIVKKLAQWQATEATATTEASLDSREMEILKLLAQGWDNARIADELHLAEQTVRNRVSRLYAKIGARSRAEAIVWARERGIE